jgi:hypothetical protein
MDTQIRDKHLDTWNIQILEQSTLDTQNIQNTTTYKALKHLDNHCPQNNILKLLNEI